MPSDKSSYFSSGINWLFMAGYAVLLIGLVSNYFIPPYIASLEYAGLKTPVEVKVDELDNYAFADFNFVQLSNFCVDEDGYEMDPLFNDGGNYYYYFLNNSCDLINGPTVILEMDTKTYEVYLGSEDDDFLRQHIYLGQLFKGYDECEALSYNIQPLVEGENVFLLKAGYTPQKAMEKVMVKMYQLELFIGCFFIAVVIANIFYNRFRKKI